MDWLAKWLRCDATLLATLSTWLAATIWYHYLGLNPSSIINISSAPQCVSSWHDSDACMMNGWARDIHIQVANTRHPRTLKHDSSRQLDTAGVISNIFHICFFQNKILVCSDLKFVIVANTNIINKSLSKSRNIYIFSRIRRTTEVNCISPTTKNDEKAIVFWDNFYISNRHVTIKTQ